jgi:cytochrome c oxidase assembly protein subunit 15
MRNFRRLAYLTVLAVYFLIFVGGLVRVAGAGLGCPDWPKCFGHWIPPLSVEEIPADVDPSSFNLTLAWIEFGNRLVGMSVGLLVLATALLAIKVHRREPRILFPSLAAALLTAYQGWQGGQVVASELKPIIVSLHLFLSFLIVSLLVYVAQRSHFLLGGAALGRRLGSDCIRDAGQGRSSTHKRAITGAGWESTAGARRDRAGHPYDFRGTHGDRDLGDRHDDSQNCG